MANKQNTNHMTKYTCYPNYMFDIHYSYTVALASQTRVADSKIVLHESGRPRLVTQAHTYGITHEHVYAYLFSVDNCARMYSTLTLFQLQTKFIVSVPSTINLNNKINAKLLIYYTNVLHKIIFHKFIKFRKHYMLQYM